MIPSSDDRLASVVRALTDVIMPSLPPEAGLAQEQIQLVIGQIQILRAQLDAAPAFEAEEAEDARALGKALIAAGEGGGETTAALAELKAATEAQGAAREARVAIHTAIDRLVKSTADDGSAAFRKAIGKIIVTMQTDRTIKDRKWFAPMGFDSGI
ncbi:MAG: hypothetical protein RL367_957 [Pseudomonadota bacterium]|jgi:hypothetical protein